jgi:cyclase
MLRARIIPCLLVKDKGLVKTTRFSDPKYVGDPINAVRIFNEKEVDEVIVLDISASARNAEPDYVMIEHLAAECRMPFCYGGGVRTIDQVQRIIRLGVEKVAISAAALTDRALVPGAAAQVGSQSIVVVLDVRKVANDRHEIFTHNGTRPTGLDPLTFASQLEAEGVGEIVINSIDNDGVMKGYDLELADRVRAVTTVPLTLLGGAGSLEDIKRLIARFGIIGAAAGSLFVFKGVYRAVLINYPKPALKRTLVEAMA